MQAVIKQAMLPATKARKATSERSALRSGARVDSAANWQPIEPGLENPHSA